MTRNYTAQVDWKLAIRLHEAGFPKEITEPLFSEVFDWLMEKGIYIAMTHTRESRRWYYSVEYKTNKPRIFPETSIETFELAATAAIEKAMEIMNNQND
jgi:hypothetical protein